MSISHSGIVQDEEWKENRIAKAGTDDAKKYGKEKTEEEKKYLSEKSPKFWLGKNRDNESIEKMRKTKLEKGFTDKQKEANYKKVYKIDNINKTIINTYESSTEASKIEGVNQSTISRWCQKNVIKNNILWTYNNFDLICE